MSWNNCLPDTSGMNEGRERTMNLPFALWGGWVGGVRTETDRGTSMTSCTLFRSIGMIVIFCAWAVRSSIIYDPDSGPKYDVQIEKDTAWTQRELTEAQIVSMADYDSHEFVCVLPKVPTEDPNTPRHNTAPVPVENLLKPLLNACFVYISNTWWSYEFCFRKHIRQFHLGKETTADVFLGKWDDTLPYDDERVTLSVEEGEERPFHRQYYSLGTDCDLTHQPRQAEVHFTCKRDSPTELVSVKEPSTCMYVVSVRTPFLCGHPLFQEEEKPALPIVCRRPVEWKAPPQPPRTPTPYPTPPPSTTIRKARQHKASAKHRSNTDRNVKDDL